MATKDSISSRETGLRYEVETSPGTLPGSPTWSQLEPNSYGDFGRQNTLTARNPITDDRQQRKGVITTYDVNANFETDVTQENLPPLLEGFFFADLRTKDEVTVTAATSTGDEFTVSSGGDGYSAGDLFNVKTGPNAGLHVVTGSPSATTIPVTTSLTNESSVSHVGRRVGFEFGAGDLEVDADGNLTTSTKDFTELDLVEGEFISIGGDASANQFATAANNTYARVLSVAANLIELDKADSTMEADNGSGKEVRVFFAPRILKNESDPSNIKKRTYQLERQLGAPDDASPSAYQFEYVEGAVPSTLAINSPSANKLTANLSFVGTDYSTRDKDVGAKSGSRPDAEQAEAFNTSEDIPRARIAKHGSADALVDNVASVTLNIDNNVDALDKLGQPSFSTNEGQFIVSGQMSAYFQTVATLQAIADNDDITFDVHFWRQNKGVSIDIPTIALGDGRPNVNQDEAVMIPLNIQGAAGSKVHDNLNHSMLVGWWDYLPDAATD